MNFKALALLALVGCTTAKPPVINPCNLERKPDEETAIGIIWETYAEWSDESVNSKTPPIVAWIDGDYFECSGGGWCYGQYIRSQHLALVAWSKQTRYFSDTSLAHELCHAWFPEDHANHSVCRNGLPPIETANKRLMRRGL